MSKVEKLIVWITAAVMLVWISFLGYLTGRAIGWLLNFFAAL